MKITLIAIALLLPMISYAGESCTTQTSEEVVQEQINITTDVPAHLKGATITVTLKNGTTSTVPAEKFKVVARKQQFVVSKTTQEKQTTCQVKADREKNRISIHAGSGPSGSLSKGLTPGKATIETETGVIGGVQYQRLTDLEVLGMPLSVGGQLQSNESALLGLGLDF